jgi:hypothetical protein
MHLRARRSPLPTIDTVDTQTYDHVPPRTDTEAAAFEAAFLLDVLQARIAEVAFTDPDELGSQHPAGRELLTLATAARRAMCALGGRPGVVVTDSPGVVVVRELVAATRALAAAVALTTRG